MTYLAQFARRFPDLPIGAVNKEHGELLKWLNETRQQLTVVVELPIRNLPSEYKVDLCLSVNLTLSLLFLQDFHKQMEDFLHQQKRWKAFERREMKSGHFPPEKFKELKDLFDDIFHR